MLIERLVEAGREMEAAGKTWPTGFGPRQVHWIMPLTEDGGQEGPMIPLGQRGTQMVMPVVERSSNVAPCLLCDTLEYALGMARDGKSAARHTAFKELLAACAHETDSPSIRAVTAFLDSGEAESLVALGMLTGEEPHPQQVVTFRVDGSFPAHERAVQDFWSRYVARELVDPDVEVVGYTCHICGQPCAPVRIWPGPPVGGIGGARRGAALVSFNDPAASSRGAAQALNAPTCLRCAERAQQVQIPPEN